MVPIPELAERIDSHCSEEKSKLDHNRENCEQSCKAPIVRHYRCDSFEQYLSSLDPKQRAFFDSVSSRLKSDECFVQKIAVDGSPMSVESVRNVVNSLTALETLAQQEAHRTDLTNSEKVVLGALYFRLRQASFTLTTLSPGAAVEHQQSQTQDLRKLVRDARKNLSTSAR